MSGGPYPGRVFIVGAQPPPVHGMAMVNAAMLKSIEGHTEVVVVNLAAKSLARSLGSRLARIPGLIAGIKRLTKSMSQDRLYIGLAGGLGQVADVVFVGIARSKGMRCFLHHHSFSYLDRWSLLTQLLVLVAGPEAIHVCLSSRMARRLRASYPQVTKLRTLSNAAVVANTLPRNPVAKSAVRTVGFLSNISVKKGIVDFLSVARRLHDARHDVRIVIAGPFEDQRIEKLVQAQISSLENAEYVGPKYGKQKDEFFAGIDVLLFPTRYANEAEPLVIYEALMHGTVVIAYDRGCISEMIGDAGVTVPSTDAFDVEAFENLQHWISSPESFAELSRKTTTRFSVLRQQASESYSALLAELCGTALRETCSTEVAKER